MLDEYTYTPPADLRTINEQLHSLQILATEVANQDGLCIVAYKYQRERTKEETEKESLKLRNLSVLLFVLAPLAANSILANIMDMIPVTKTVELSISPEEMLKQLEVSKQQLSAKKQQIISNSEN